MADVTKKGVGTLEAFNTDGLRTLARTLKAPFTKEKTRGWTAEGSRLRPAPGAAGAPGRPGARRAR